MCLDRDGHPASSPLPDSLAKDNLRNAIESRLATSVRETSEANLGQHGVIDYVVLTVLGLERQFRLPDLLDNGATL